MMACTFLLNFSLERFRQFAGFAMKMPEICLAHINTFCNKMSDENNLKGKKGEFWLMSSQGSVYGLWLHRVQSMAHGFTEFSLWPFLPSMG